MIAVDANNRVTHYNRGAQKMLGIGPVEAKGRPISDFVDNGKLLAMLARQGSISEGPVYLRGLDLWATLFPMYRDHGGMMLVLVQALKKK